MSDRAQTGSFASTSPQALQAGIGETQETVSPLLYLAGLMVTLSGLFCVNFGLEDQGFALMTYALATGGYVTSYVLRARRLSLKGLHIPILVALILCFFTALTSDRGLGIFSPVIEGDDRAKSLQLVFAWMAILHSYTLSTDAAVLFACVPCMTMIALVSTTSPYTEIQNAFLLFIGSATFLMVHENFLRTRNAIRAGRSSGEEKRLFGGQLQLTFCCVMGALVLANFVAVPIKTVGQSLFIPQFNQANNQNAKPSNQPQQSVVVSESSSIDLTRGPGSESDLPILNVRSERGLYWRGSTLDYYTGTTFENRVVDRNTLTPTEGEQDARTRQDQITDFTFSGGQNAPIDASQFTVPQSLLELRPEQMQGSHVVRQRVSIVGGSVSQYYGAGNIIEIRSPMRGMVSTPAGSLTSYTNFPMGMEYIVKSAVPDDDPDRLRTASSSLDEAPDTIRTRYLQTQANGVENTRLRALAQEITRGKTNNYDKAAAIHEYIARTCKYNLQAAAPPRGVDVVENFLFDAKQGYCDKFGAAMTMLCRYAGIPARLASGFLPGDSGKDMLYVVREKHKHIWTEVFFPHYGWIVFDATEGAEDISDHSGQSKKKANGFLAWLMSQGALPPLLAILIISLVVYLLKTEVWDRLRVRREAERAGAEMPRTNREVVAAYQAACKALARRGLARPSSATPDEFYRSIETHGETLPTTLEEPFKRLTALCTRYRYGPDIATQEDVQMAQAAAAAVTEAIAGVRKAIKPAVSQASG